MSGNFIFIKDHQNQLNCMLSLYTPGFLISLKTTEPGVSVTFLHILISFEIKLLAPITTFFPMLTFPEITTLHPILQKLSNKELCPIDTP